MSPGENEVWEPSEGEMQQCTQLLERFATAPNALMAPRSKRLRAALMALIPVVESTVEAPSGNQPEEVTQQQAQMSLTDCFDWPGCSGCLGVWTMGV